MVADTVALPQVHQLNTSWTEAKKQNYIKHATREYEIHRTLKHENVVELHGTGTKERIPTELTPCNRVLDVFEIDANSFCTVLEYCPGQDLDFLLKQEQKLGGKLSLGDSTKSWQMS
jgi:tousled-like kinase